MGRAERAREAHDRRIDEAAKDMMCIEDNEVLIRYGMGMCKW